MIVGVGLSIRLDYIDTHAYGTQRSAKRKIRGGDMDLLEFYLRTGTVGTARKELGYDR